MTQEQFEHITVNCQPHKVFYNDWSQYYSDDFADTLLPDAGLLKGEAFRGNKNRKEPEKQRKQLRVDFNIKEKTVTQYNITVLWKDEILYEMSFIPEVKITPYVKTETEKAVFTQEKQTVYWDCTEFMGILTRTERITVRIVAKDSDGNTSLSARIVNPSDMFKKPVKNNYIVFLDADNNEHTIYGDDIIRRQESFIEKIPKAVYDTLSDTHKLILHLPEIMVKLDWIHGALCQIHWLEGSGKSLKFPYEFFMSEKRVEDFDVKNLREYFKGVRYLSFENLGYSPSNPDGENIFLYNDTSKLPVILESLKLFHENLSKKEDCGPVGGNERFKTERSETESFVNENLFLSYSIGYEDGDFDDIGAALGKYAMRCYYQGWLDKNYQLGQWVLNVESVKCRFFDDFNFDDDKKVWWKPLTWFSQMLGYWDSDTNDPKEPFYFGIKIRQNLNNKKFRQLRNVLQVSLNNCCNDFYIFSNIKTIDDEFVKKSIIILGEY